MKTTKTVQDKINRIVEDIRSSSFLAGFIAEQVLLGVFEVPDKLEHTIYVDGERLNYTETEAWKRDSQLLAKLQAN